MDFPSISRSVRRERSDRATEAGVPVSGGHRRHRLGVSLAGADGDEGLPAIGFYPPEDRPGLEHLLEIVDGVELIYAITGKDYHASRG